MDEEDRIHKKIMHIDTSCKLYERKSTGIAFKIIDSNQHKGLGLSLKLKKELEKNLMVNKNYAGVYAISIYYLIKDNLNDFDILVICGDENFTLVNKYLNKLFQDNLTFSKKEILSIGEIRRRTGNKKLKSYADNIASSYRKRALKSRFHQQKGISLNIIQINYKMFKEKWREIDDKNVSGE